MRHIATYGDCAPSQNLFSIVSYIRAAATAPEKKLMLSLKHSPDISF